MERCWAEDPAARPPFTDILRELHSMGKQLKDRMRRQRRQQAAPHANGDLPGLPEGSS
jgi:hypothetical protein